MIDRLPAASHYAEAQANDEDLARAWILSGGERSEFRPRISTWDPAVAELANITDRLTELANILVAANGGKPKQVKPRPRPQTAIDRIEHAVRREQHEQLVTRILGRPPTP